MSLPIDRTNLTAAQTNQVPNALIRSALNIAALTTPYNTIDELNAKVDALISSGALSPYPPAQYNQLINGGFAVNQRVVSGTVTLAAGAYGHDRWKAGASGCTYTFATSANVTTITITAGSLIQVIEGTSLLSGTYTLSWTGTSQGKIGVGSYAATGITGSAAGGTNLNIEFNVGTLSKVQFNAGSVALPFQPRSFPEELKLCKWYYQRLDSSGASGNNAVYGSGLCYDAVNALILLNFEQMRIKPTVTFSAVAQFALYSAAAATITITTFTQGTKTDRSLSINCAVAAGLVAGNSTHLISNNNITSKIEFDAEL